VDDPRHLGVEAAIAISLLDAADHRPLLLAVVADVMAVLGGNLHPRLDVTLVAAAPHEDFHHHHDHDGNGDGGGIEQRPHICL